MTDLKIAPLYAEAQKLGFDNPPWETARFRFLVIRLSPWRDVDRSSPHLFLYRLIRSTLGPEAYIDFAFFPSRPDRKTLTKAGLPWLSGIASLRVAADFDTLLVSCSYALELVNLPLYLLNSGIPALASQRRTDSKKWPLIILGGSNSLASQSVIFEDGDSFADGIFFGEGEAGGKELIETLVSSKNMSTDERSLALEGANPAFWASLLGSPSAPRTNGPLRRIKPGRCSLLLDTEPLLLTSYPLLNSDAASTARLQISWGCPAYCTFCFEGWERKPYRELSKAQVLQAARELAQNTGASTLEIYSFNFNVHEDALQLIFELNKIFDKVNMMSQRADVLVRTSGMLACELAAEKRSFTVGVEGISESMRSYYAKGLSETDLRHLMEALARESIRELKLFYIISGLETEADIAEFRQFCAFLKQLSDDFSKGFRALFSAGYLVRMPFTPLHGTELILDKARLEPIAQAMKTSAEEFGFEFRVAMDFEEYVSDQLLVAGGYELAEALLNAAKEGIAYDGGMEGRLSPYLIRSLRQSGALESSQQSGSMALTGPLLRAKPAKHSYPLAFIDANVPDSFLEARRQDAEERIEKGTCLGEDLASCQGCSACEDDDERSFITNHKVKNASGMALAENIAAVIKEKRKERPVFIQVQLPDSLAGAESAFLSAYLLRTLFSSAPELIGSLHRIEDALWNSNEKKDQFGPGIVGENVLAFYGKGSEDIGGNPCLSPENTKKICTMLETKLETKAAILEDFSLEKISSIHLRISLPITDEKEALRLVRAWLAALKLASTERRSPEGGWDFDIAPKDKKKRIVEGVELRSSTKGYQELYIKGTKLNLSALFPKAGERTRSLIQIKSLLFI